MWQHWQNTSDVREVVEYVHAFRAAHHESFAAKAPFHSDDLGEYGQYVLGELIYTPEYQGAWERLADVLFAEQVAAEVRVLWPRLNEYIARSKEVVEAS